MPWSVSSVADPNTRLSTLQAGPGPGPGPKDSASQGERKEVQKSVDGRTRKPTTGMVSELR